MPLFELSDKGAVITGGTPGRALSLGLAEAGADVIATACHEPSVDEAASAIEAPRRRTLRVTSDVSDRASLENLQAPGMNEFGKIGPTER